MRWRDDDMIMDIGPQAAAEDSGRYCARPAPFCGTARWACLSSTSLPPAPRLVARAIADSPAFSLAGGGDTLAAIDKFGIADKVSYISTGGGAFLEYVEGKTLPAVAMLEQRAGRPPQYNTTDHPIPRSTNMALISMRQLLDHAAEHGYGVPAFNVNNLEQTRAIMEAADKTNSPVIMQASAGARKYAGAPFLRAMMEAAMNEFPHIPVVVHQDHGVSPAVCQRSIQLGFSSVMMDGSLGEDGKTPMDYDYNVAVTRKVVESGPRLRRLGGG